MHLWHWEDTACDPASGHLLLKICNETRSSLIKKAAGNCQQVQGRSIPDAPVVTRCGVRELPGPGSIPATSQSCSRAKHHCGPPPGWAKFLQEPEAPREVLSPPLALRPALPFEYGPQHHGMSQALSSVLCRMGGRGAYPNAEIIAQKATYPKGLMSG